MSQQSYTKYYVFKEFQVRSGDIAPWFDEVGGGKQYKSKMGIIDKYGETQKQ